MKLLMATIGVAMLLTSPLSAQNRQQRQQQMRQMRQQVTQRFLRSYVQTSGLDESQRVRFRGKMEESFEWGASNAERRGELWEALEGQMRPGIAADVDSVNGLISDLTQSIVDEARYRQTQVADLAEFLSPIQTAQFMIHMERFQRQVESVRGRRGRMQGGPPGGGL